MMTSESRSETKFCTECGEQIRRAAEICPKCGVRQHGSALLTVAPNGKSKLVAALLALFLGGFGAHKFYLGQIGVGILYLLFSWTFIPAVIALVEFIILLSMRDEVFVAKYGTT